MTLPSIARTPELDRSGDAWGGLLRRAAPFLVAAGAWVLLRRVLRLEVRGASMTPTIADGDWIVAISGLVPAPDDIVIVRDPRHPGRSLVKRLIRIEPDGRLWIEGDNAAASTDSRSFGPVHPALVTGRVLARYWPWPPHWLAARRR